MIMSSPSLMETFRRARTDWACMPRKEESLEAGQFRLDAHQDLADKPGLRVPRHFHPIEVTDWYSFEEHVACYYCS